MTPPQAATDVDLLERCRAGDIHAYRSIVSLWGDRLVRVATLVAGDRARGEAALRDGLRTAWSALPSLHSEHAIQPWVLGHIAAAAIARADVPPAGVDGAKDDARDAGPADGTTVSAAERCLRSVGPEERAVIILVAYAGLAPGEAMGALGWTQPRGAARLRRAARTVKACLGTG